MHLYIAFSLCLFCLSSFMGRASDQTLSLIDEGNEGSISSSSFESNILSPLEEGTVSLLTGLKSAESAEILTEEEQIKQAQDFTTDHMKQKNRKALFSEDSDLYTNLLIKHSMPITYLTGLSIDGGGTRGLIPAILLEYLSSKLNKPLYHYFDYIGGTSIGGIIALGLTARSPIHEDQPLIEMDNVVKLFDLSYEIFPRAKVKHRPLNLPMKLWDGLKYLITEAKTTVTSRYDVKGFTGLLQQYFGEKSYLHETLTHTLVTAVDTGYQRSQTFLFDSRDAEKLYNNFETRIPLWKVGRSTSAAPTYFKAHKFIVERGDGKILSEHQLVDGGLWLNNPTALVVNSLLNWAHDEYMYASDKNIVQLSLGTGYSEVGKSLPSNAGLLTAASPVINTLMSVSSFSVHEEMSKRLGKRNYVRINPKLSDKIELDESNPEKLKVLREAAEQEFEEIDRFIDGPFRKVLEKDEFRAKKTN